MVGLEILSLGRQNTDEVNTAANTHMFNILATIVKNVNELPLTALKSAVRTN